MRDNRKHERFNLELPAKVVTMQPESKEEKIIDLLTKDVSAGGAFFHTDKPLPAGTEVKIDLILPLDELRKIKGKRARLKIDGKVLRSDEKGMAVCFNKNYKILPL